MTLYGKSFETPEPHKGKRTSPSSTYQVFLRKLIPITSSSLPLYALLLFQNQARIFHCLRASHRSPYCATCISFLKSYCMEGLPQLWNQRRLGEGKSTTDQLHNLTQHTENGFERLVTGAVFIKISTAYDTVNHRILMTKIYQMIDDKAMIMLLGTLLKSRMLNLILDQKKSRWQQQ